MPKVIERTDSYNPIESVNNLINHEEEEKPALKGTFNPDYAIQKQKMMINYFDSSSETLHDQFLATNEQDDAEPHQDIIYGK